MIHSGGKPFYNQRCPRCHLWTTGNAPSSHCSKCQAALPHHLHPLAQEAEAPGPEYGAISPEMTPESNLKSLKLATALTAPLSNEHAAQVYRVVNLIPLLWWLSDDPCPQLARNPSLDDEPGPVAGLGLFYSAFLLKAITRRVHPTMRRMRTGCAVFSHLMPGCWLAGRIIWPSISLSGCGSIALVWPRRRRRACPCS